MVKYSQDKGKEVHIMKRIKIKIIVFENNEMVKIVIVSKPAK